MTFADPHLVVPEVARVLRSGGLFAFSLTSSLAWICWDDEVDEVVARAPARLLRPAPPRGSGRLGHLPAPGRRVDPPLPPQRARGRGSDRAAAARGRDDDVRVRPRLGAPLADGADLEGAQAVSLLRAREPEPRGLDGVGGGVRRAGAAQLGARGDRPGASGTCPSRSSARSPTWPGKDVIELGCGTAYVSAWLARLGARPVGVDVTPAQLETARAMQKQFGLEFPLLEASAEDVPLPDASFDLAVSEYGASIWCDPYRWIPEAARLLRPGGELVFLVNGTLSMLCAPDEEVAAGPRAAARLLRHAPLRVAGRGRRSSSTSATATDPAAARERLRGRGPDRDPGAGGRAAASRHPALPTPDWARRWPAEEIWRARKAG